MKKEEVKTDKVEETKKTDDHKKYDDLVKQIQYEYDLCWEHQKSRKDEQLLRLKLYNNQKRDKEAAGDTTLFTTMQTVLASLYADKLMVEFNGREEGDDDIAKNLNDMAKFDYEEMGKDMIDYDYIFDTCFTGHGILNQTEYVRDPENNIFVPVAEAVDPLVFLRDPRATRINGEGLLMKNACRFFGREIRMSKESMKKNSNFFKDIKWEDLNYDFGTHSIYDDAIQARTDANGNQNVKSSKEENLGCNGEYAMVEWYTHYILDGKTKKVRAWIGNDRTTLLGIQILPDGKWGYTDRLLYPTSHDWDGTSIPDLVEDKQRLRAVAQNLGIKAMKADLYPMYVYDSNKITNRNDLNFDYNKFIPADSPNAATVQPLRKAAPNMQLLDFIYQTLDISAQKATATPEIQQGQMSSEKRTLGEINIVASKVDTRYSLAAKLFSNSEKRFWQQWYAMYKEYFAEGIDEKIVRIKGSLGNSWRKLTKDQIITKHLDPDVSIESLDVSRAKQLEDRAMFTQYFGLAMQDPTCNRRYGMKKLGKLNNMEKEEVDRLFPPTVDERIAESENKLLSENKMALIHAEDDHNIHLEIHNKASETAAKAAHMATHIKALSIKKTNPELFPTPEEEMGTNMNPDAAATTPTPTPTTMPTPINASQASGMM